MTDNNYNPLMVGIERNGPDSLRVACLRHMDIVADFEMPEWVLKHCESSLQSGESRATPPNNTTLQYDEHDVILLRFDTGRGNVLPKPDSHRTKLVAAGMSSNRVLKTRNSTVIAHSRSPFPASSATAANHILRC